MQAEETTTLKAHRLPRGGSMSINRFCRRNEISRSRFYELMKEGLAPITFRIGRARRISFEAERSWIRQLEAMEREVTNKTSTEPIPRAGEIHGAAVSGDVPPPGVHG